MNTDPIKRANLRKDGTDYVLIQRGELFSIFDPTFPYVPHENYTIAKAWDMAARVEVSLWLIDLGFEITSYEDG